MYERRHILQGAATLGLGGLFMGGAAWSKANAAVRAIIPSASADTLALKVLLDAPPAHAPRLTIDGRIVIDIWSDEPNDFEGVYFVIEKRAVVADMTIERWKDYDRADREWRIRDNAFVKGEVSAGRSEYVDFSVKTPPPPPPRSETQPPRPSTHARWIPGYWQYAEGQFHWLAGMWDVPEEDIAKDLTVHAPTAPPPPPVAVEQPQEARPTTTAVWTPGQWQWDGRAYVWIAGAWRIPPTQQHEWKPATWSVSTRGAIFVPGGWRISVRLK